MHILILLLIFIFIGKYNPEDSSFKVPLCVKLTIWSVVLITFPHLSLFSEIVIKILFPIWVFILFTLFCGTFVLIPNATGTVFGPVNLAVNYGLVFLAFVSF
ncbi:uncharacterized protein DC041_0000728 [Schistosoma bovis]|uniref:Uncharacterized protein n=1 Tax=Schistosoma bovis TaxID=6184 RepID=A0A430QMZ6_SCHBO|nr:uncharacterized protein DC041_0000728 [Schistosoma bovis]